MVKTFYIPYFSDERMKYVSEYLKSNGFEYDEDNPDITILPIPAKKEMFTNLKSKYVFYGYSDYDGYDYNKNEAYLLKNAFITAEGAIKLYYDNSDIALIDQNVLICGYGRIARSLHKILSAIGAKVTICSRSGSSKAEAIKNGANHIHINDLLKKNEYDVVFNTIPHLIFTKGELDALPKNTTIIDLASFPGGVDTLYSKSKNIKLIDGRKLPARYFPKSAGYYIGEAIIEIIKEERI